MISTQVESLQKLDRQQRYNMILDKLSEIYPEGMTAKELANTLGFIERNATAPRLTELEKKYKRVKTNGTRYDEKTNRNVAVYVLNKEDTNEDISI